MNYSSSYPLLSAIPLGVATADHTFPLPPVFHILPITPTASISSLTTSIHHLLSLSLVYQSGSSIPSSFSLCTYPMHPNFRTELKIREFAYSKRILPNPNFVARFGRIRRFGRLYVKQHSAKRKQLTIINSRLSRTNTESRISGICTSLAELKRKWNKEKHACKTRKQITNQEEKTRM